MVEHGESADLSVGPTLVARHLTGELGCASDPAVRGVFTTDTPFPARIDLRALEQRPPRPPPVRATARTASAGPAHASVRTSVPSCPHRVWKLPSASVRR